MGYSIKIDIFLEIITNIHTSNPYNTGYLNLQDKLKLALILVFSGI